jgi:hypothetical protein
VNHVRRRYLGTLLHENKPRGQLEPVGGREIDPEAASGREWVTTRPASLCALLPMMINDGRMRERVVAAGLLASMTKGLLQARCHWRDDTAGTVPAHGRSSIGEPGTVLIAAIAGGHCVKLLEAHQDGRKVTAAVSDVSSAALPWESA